MHGGNENTFFSERQAQGKQLELDLWHAIDAQGHIIAEDCDFVGRAQLAFRHGHLLATPTIVDPYKLRIGTEDSLSRKS